MAPTTCTETEVVGSRSIRWRAHRLRSLNRDIPPRRDLVGADAEVFEYAGHQHPVPGRDIDQSGRPSAGTKSSQRSRQDPPVPLGRSRRGQIVALPAVARRRARVVAVSRVVQGELHVGRRRKPRRLCATISSMIHAHGGIVTREALLASATPMRSAPRFVVHGAIFCIVRIRRFAI